MSNDASGAEPADHERTAERHAAIRAMHMRTKLVAFRSPAGNGLASARNFSRLIMTPGYFFFFELVDEMSRQFTLVHSSAGCLPDTRADERI